MANLIRHWELFTWVHWGLITLALLGCLVALGAVNRMNRHTECTIIISFLTTGAGLVGYFLGALFPGKWTLSCDFLLVGGVAAIMIGSRKRTIWIEPELMPWISLAVSGVSWAAFLGAI